MFRRDKNHYNLQQDQTLQRVPSLQVHHVVQLIPALQRDQQDQHHHGDHGDHPYQRDQRHLGVQQYPKMGTKKMWLNVQCDPSVVHVVCELVLISLYEKQDKRLYMYVS